MIVRSRAIRLASRSSLENRNRSAKAPIVFFGRAAPLLNVSAAVRLRRLPSSRNRSLFCFRIRCTRHSSLHYYSVVRRTRRERRLVSGSAYATRWAQVSWIAAPSGSGPGRRTTRIPTFAPGAPPVRDAVRAVAGRTAVRRSSLRRRSLRTNVVRRFWYEDSLARRTVWTALLLRHAPAFCRSDDSKTCAI